MSRKITLKEGVTIAAAANSDSFEYFYADFFPEGSRGLIRLQMNADTVENGVVTPSLLVSVDGVNWLAAATDFDATLTVGASTTYAYDELTMPACYKFKVNFAVATQNAVGFDAFLAVV